MQVFRISRAKYAPSLQASGRANRWNRDGQFVIYTAANRALSVLEMVVHRSAIFPKETYKLLAISLDLEQSDCYEVSSQLPSDWYKFHRMQITQHIGTQWYQAKDQMVMKVPSAVVKNEFNFVVNTLHPDFSSKVKVSSVEDFQWDQRLF